ncbi:hypothetical protein V2G26_018010 [Clonostachys chloroleuca]|uniref:Uncharacterized protein n=4 Tax=Clonostachys TaxID=110564 RepID=A0A0B7JW96_BIOOC|nr:unnamed protein product [Clonostachys rosea f. rosea IK726]CAH0026199.1 unnamed protein product [Clonostachys rhizophaga]CAI6093025.1 unnamed protein product [Clonostachys chloroleuca]
MKVAFVALAIMGLLGTPLASPLGQLKCLTRGKGCSSNEECCSQECSPSGALGFDDGGKPILAYSCA